MGISNIKDKIGIASKKVKELPHNELSLPLERLAELSMSQLKSTNTLERASKSSLYQKKWREAGIRVNEIESYSDLVKIPFTTGKDVREAMNEHTIDSVLCSNEVVQWFSTTGMTGTAKWIPYSQKDVEQFFKIRDRGNKITPPVRNLRAMAVSSPAPFIECGLSAFERTHAMMLNTQREGVDICLTEWENSDAFSFVLGLKPNLLAAWPAFAAQFAEVIREKAPAVALDNFRKQQSIRNFLEYLITRVKEINPRDISDFKWGLFGGEPLDPYRRILTESFGMEPYETYLLTEYPCGAVECREHDGMHLWLDFGVHEIILKSELEKEAGDTSYTPKTIPLWAADDGAKGEYVFTTFGDALPLIRYRSGDLIKLISKERCKCGVTHPRIKVLRRSDSTICLGAFRIKAEQFEEKLLTDTPHGKGEKWQLEIGRKGYHIQPVISIESHNVMDKEAFLSEISAKLKELKTLRMGIENKIILEPKLLLVDRVSDAGQSAATIGRVIYEE